jgi:hypothetical protein
MDTIRDDCTELGISTFEAVILTQGTVLWKNIMTKLPRSTQVFKGLKSKYLIG